MSGGWNRLSFHGFFVFELLSAGWSQWSHKCSDLIISGRQQEICFLEVGCVSIHQTNNVIGSVCFLSNSHFIGLSRVPTNWLKDVTQDRRSERQKRMILDVLSNQQLSKDSSRVGTHSGEHLVCFSPIVERNIISKNRDLPGRMALVIWHRQDNSHQPVKSHLELRL